MSQQSETPFGLTSIATRRRFVALLGLSAGAGLLAACAPAAAPSPTAAPAKPAEQSKTEAAKPAAEAAQPTAAAAPAAKQGEAGPTNIPHAASLTWWGHVPLMVAIEKGMFQEVGLNVTLEPFVASSDRILALTGGSVQWSNLGSSAVLAEMAKGNESFYWFANVDDSPGNQGIVVRPGIETWADLKGKKLAVTQNTDSEIMVYDLLEENGLKPTSDLELIPLKANEMVAAFANRSIDAYAVWEPIFSDGQAAVAGSKVLARDTDTPIYKKYGTQTAPDVVIIRRELADKYPETTRTLLTAYFKGVDLVKSNPEEAATLVHEKYFKKTQEEALAGIKGFNFFGAKEQTERTEKLLGTLSAVIDWQYNNKRVTEKPDPRKWLRADLAPA